jgi:Tol biopolymer transport system component
MPSENKTPTQRPRRPATSAERPRSGLPSATPPGKGRPSGRNKFWKNVWENVGWGLVIGLPIILVILAILWRATNGFQGTGPSDSALPTTAPTATAGTYLAPPAISGAKDRLGFLQAPDVNNPMQVYSSNLDGSNLTQLTNSGELKAAAVWSPDGKQIAFTADGVGVEVVNYDGSGLHTLAYGGFNPVWSPDGKQLAFLKNSPAPDGQGPDRTGTIRVLHVIKADGKPGDEKQLASDALAPNWSPDGKQIAFFSLRNAVMFTVDVASGKTDQINVPNKMGGWYPTFSPDGQTLVFYGDPNPSAMVNALDLAVAAGNTTTVDTGLPSPTPAPTTASAATTPAPTGTGAAAGTPGATVAGTPGATTAAGTPGSPTPAVSPSPTAIPGPPSQVSLYQINKDGSGLKKLQDLEPAGGSGGGKFRFMYYVATSADAVSVLTARPYYRVGPVFSSDGKNIAALYVASGDKVGLAIVHPDGSPATLVVDGENGLETGLRLNPSFGSDNSKLYYSFTSTKPAASSSATPTPGVSSVAPTLPKQARFFDLAGKAEKPLFASADPRANYDTTYITCCGYARK